MLARAEILTTDHRGSFARWSVMAGWAAVFAGLTVLGVVLTRVPLQPGIAWIAQAVALARMLTLRETARPEDIVAALFAGVLAGGVATGHGVGVAVAHALASLLTLGAAYALYRKLLRFQWPHDSENAYLTFIALVAVPAAALSGLAGASLAALDPQETPARAALDWIVACGVGFAGGTPLAAWLMQRRDQRYTFPAAKKLWTALTLTGLALVIGTALTLQEEVKGLLVSILLVSLCALRTGRVGTMTITAALVPLFALSGVLDSPQMLAGGLLAPGSEVLSFAAVFTCAALPANLIAAMIARLQQAERIQRDIAEMKVRFLSSMSHEIKTPMNAIHGMFELFGRSELTERQRRWADAGLSASRNLQAQVSQILDMASLEEKSIRIAAHPADLRGMLETWLVAAEASVMAAGKDIAINGTLDDRLPARAMLDEGRVHQIVTNLLSNAVKFTESGSISIALQNGRDTLIIEVADTGIGISANDQPLVFERFWQVEDGAARHKDGSGLGLAISRELAQLMGGRLTLRSTPGTGSIFRLIVPLRPVRGADT